MLITNALASFQDLDKKHWEYVGYALWDLAKLYGERLAEFYADSFSVVSYNFTVEINKIIRVGMNEFHENPMSNWSDDSNFNK